jgi:hypothetical protein
VFTDNVARLPKVIQKSMAQEIGLEARAPKRTRARKNLGPKLWLRNVTVIWSGGDSCLIPFRPPSVARYDQRASSIIEAHEPCARIK